MYRSEDYSYMEDGDAKGEKRRDAEGEEAVCIVLI